MANVGLVDESVTSGEDTAREGIEGVVLGDRTTQTPTVTQEENSRKRKCYSHHANDNGGADDTVRVSKRRQGIGQPRFPPHYLRQYDSSHYSLYDHETGNVGPSVSQAFRTFAQYDKYTVFMSPALKRVEDIPTSGVRLDDMTAAFVLRPCAQKTLHTNWPAEFDTHGMIRATRMPLGHAAKFWKEEGDVDVDGNIVPEGGAGYYYKWWRGLHCLCGKEGLDRNVYQIRPSFETFRCPDFGFKVSSRAKIQKPSGDPADPTFTSSSASAAPTSSTAS